MGRCSAMAPSSTAAWAPPPGLPPPAQNKQGESGGDDDGYGDDWSQWVAELPPEGHGEWSKREWLEYNEEWVEQQRRRRERPAVGEVVPLTEANAKKRKAERSALRLQGFKTKGPRYRPPPPLCNRNGSSWGAPPLACQCHHWPAWMQENKPSGCTEVIVKSGTKMTVGQGDPFAVWTATAKGEHFYYHGVHRGAYLVRFPSGKLQPVMVVS